MLARVVDQPEDRGREVVAGGADSGAASPSVVSPSIVSVVSVSSTAGGGAAPEEADFAGTSRFAVRRRMGAGAFGTVYDVWDTLREEHVALKVLRQIKPEMLISAYRQIINTAHARGVKIPGVTC